MPEDPDDQREIEAVDEDQSPLEERDTASPGEAGEKRGSSLVYLALAAGAAVLVVLLLIVWISSRDDGSNELPLCLDISGPAASDAVLAGRVSTIDVLIDEDRPLEGLSAIQLRMIDGECRRLPEGADNRDVLYQVLGAAALYNEAGEKRVDVRYLRQDVPAALLSTSTPEPSPTSESIPTPTVSSTPRPSVTPTSEPAATATTAPSPAATATSSDASPVASPIASGSPVAIEASPSPAASPAIQDSAASKP
ncbi:MAG: hypothetical protein AB7V46_20790 [Thermomicrobiales bacterium]